MVLGYWYRFNYTAEHAPNTDYSLFNFHVSYKLRRLRLIGGYVEAIARSIGRWPVEYLQHQPEVLSGGAYFPVILRNVARMEST